MVYWITVIMAAFVLPELTFETVCWVVNVLWVYVFIHCYYYAITHTHTHTHTQCKLELKPLEPVYHDVRVVIPQLECSMSVEYDQFSTVGDVLQQVLSLTEPPLDPSQGYSLYHVRLRMK